MHKILNYSVHRGGRVGRRCSHRHAVHLIESAHTFKRWRRSSIIIISLIFWADTRSVHYACARTNEIFGRNLSVDRLLTAALNLYQYTVESGA